MASLMAEGPDPKTFKSWEDAFKYPVPTTRRFQQQLKGDITSNRERLRSLVGGSYRDLLGTADAIVQMDYQMKEVEVHLGSTSRRCNTDRLSHSFQNATKLLSSRDSSESELFVTISQMAVLQACPDVVVRILRKNGSVCMAAKVLVIARRLYRALSDDSKIAGMAKRTWSRLANLRQKLLRLIDRRLVNPKTDEAGIIDALCAFALATSSASAADLLRHFHRVRLDTFSARASKGPASIPNNLRLWIRTLQDTRTIFQKPLVAGLARLKSEPILKDDGIQAISEFNLEIHEMWLGEDIRNFTPYLRHDDLAVSAAAQQLSEWAPAALKALLSNLQQTLGSVDDVREVVKLRQDCLELLFSHYHIAGVRKELVLTGFREAFSARLEQLVEMRCGGLASVGSAVKDIIKSSSSDSFGLPSSLWSDTLVHIDTTRGAEDFTSAVHDTLHGFTPTVRTITDKYRLWLDEIEVIDEVIVTMRNIKWEDHLDLDSDTESETEDEAQPPTKQIQVLLKDSDPKSLQNSISKRLTSSFKAFTASIQQLTPEVDAPQAQAQAAFLLRVVREIQQNLPLHAPTDSIALTGTLALHKMLALPPVASIVGQHQQSIRSSIRRKSPAGRGLWDGAPPFPGLPSPWVFRLLQDLEGALAEVGTDLWTSDAVAALKDALSEKLLEVLELPLTSFKGTKVAKDGASGEEEGKSEQPSEFTANNEKENSTLVPFSGDTAKQLFFDLSFLACMDAPRPPDEGAEGGNRAAEDANGTDDSQSRSMRPSALTLQRRVLESARLDGLPAARLAKQAQEYRKRTALLFPLVN